MPNFNWGDGDEPKCDITAEDQADAKAEWKEYIDSRPDPVFCGMGYTFGDEPTGDFLDHEGNTYRHVPERSTSHDKEYHLVHTTLQERHILEHSLGIQVKAGKKTPGGYRNYFYSPYRTDTHQMCLGLVKKGLMRQGLMGSDDYFSVTPAGMREIGFTPKDGDQP